MQLTQSYVIRKDWEPPLDPLISNTDLEPVPDMLVIAATSALQPRTARPGGHPWNRHLESSIRVAVESMSNLCNGPILPAIAS
jgi:hypothetical protein